MMVSPDFLTQFEAERDALRATNRQLAEANATLTAELAALVDLFPGTGAVTKAWQRWGKLFALPGGES